MRHGVGTEDRGQDAVASRSVAGRLTFTLLEFIHNEAFGGILLLACAVVALVWANSPWGNAYVALWEKKLTIGFDGFGLSETLHHWINDGLMALFFFVVGLEIKREVLVGELSSPRQAALPAIAAVGGVLVPGGIYTALNAGGPGAGGWGIPQATDIAFALGVLALLGDRVPGALKVFLTALAIVDDVAAVLVIALFYTAAVSWSMLGLAALLLVALVLANRLGVRAVVVYGLIGLAVWVAVLESGIHASVAGVLVALTIPTRTRMDPDAFVDHGRGLLDQFEGAGQHGRDILTNGPRQEVLQELEAACEDVGAPLQRLEHALHPWVAFAIVPLFALANAGVRFEGSPASALGERVTLGVVLGLVVGKQVGVTLFAWLATRLGLTVLPEGIGWRQIYGVGWLAGIGFTMSLFVAELAFADQSLLAAAKIGILVASAIAGLLGWLILGRWALVGASRPEPAAA